MKANWAFRVKTCPSIHCRDWRLIPNGKKAGVSQWSGVRLPLSTKASSRREDVAAPTAHSPPTAAVSDFRPAMFDEFAGNSQVLEEKIEKGIYRCRFFTILAVSGSLVGSVLCFLKGCTCVADSFTEYFRVGGKVIPLLVEAIDIYLLGTVMLVFGMGLYELFISNLDFAHAHQQFQHNGKHSYRSNLFGLFKLLKRPQWLEIQTVNELKTKLGHVIVMVLLVGFFEKCNKVVISTPTDLLCFSASILLSSGCLFLLSKLKDVKQKNHA